MRLQVRPHDTDEGGRRSCGCPLGWCAWCCLACGSDAILGDSREPGIEFDAEPVPGNALRSDGGSAATYERVEHQPRLACGWALASRCERCAGGGSAECANHAPC